MAETNTATPIIDANTGRPVEPFRFNPQQMASIINIPPQVAVTVFWVAVGFGLCWWLTNKNSRIVRG